MHTYTVAGATSETIFDVLGASARQRSWRALALQLLVSLALAVGCLVVAPRWWSCAAFLGVSASYAAWGLLAARAGERSGSPRVLHALAHGAAAAGTALAVAGVLGLAAALFTGRGRSPYNACGRNATSVYCRAIANPTKGQIPRP